MFEFYNAGHRIDETFAFSLPEGQDTHTLGHWAFRAPKESWFDVPREIEIGNQTIHVNFASDVRRKFAIRGVVLLDPKWDAKTEDPERPLDQYAIASTRQAAEERGHEIWMLYTKTIVESHLADCQAAMAAGGAPHGARGFTKNCLKLHGINDPAEDYFLSLKTKQGGGEMSGDVKAILHQMQAQNAQAQVQSQTMMAIIMALATGQKIDPELLKHALEAAPVIPVNQSAAMPSTSGINTGEIKKPITTEDGWNKVASNSKTSQQRKQEAAAALK